MLKRYPSIRPYATYTLPVQEPHVLYIEESGSADGIPVLVVHGGPGAGSHPDQRRLFDPNIYRIILFDQRGSGQSTPTGELENNNTQALIEDIEAIRKFLNIEKWVVYGGSWGSTLSLLYAQSYPKQISALILRSVLLANEQDFRWFFNEGGASRIFPDYWQEFAGAIPPKERNHLLEAYYQRLNTHSELEQMKAAKAWSLWHRRCATLNPIPEVSINNIGTMRIAKIECYYFMNQCFIEPNQVLNNVYALRDIPAIIIHGRYDMITSLSNSQELCQHWRKAELNIVRDAGHASTELTDAIIEATDKIAKMLNEQQPTTAT
jgi:proline iminopeptidase